MVVVRIKDLNQVLRQILLLDRLLVITLVKCRKAERVDRLCIPDTQGVDYVIAVADNRHIIRNCQNRLITFLYKMVALTVPLGLDITAKFNLGRILRAAKLERITVFQPLIRHLHLIAVFNFLLEHTVMVTDAAAVSRITKSCQGIQKTCCQTPQTAVSKCRIRLLILNRIEVKTKLFQCFLHCFFRTQVDDIVTKRTSHQKLHRKVIYLLCACLVKLLLSCNPVVDNHILDRIGHSLEYLLRCRLVDRSAVLVLYIFDNTLFKLFFADLAHPVLLIFVVSRFPARHISQSFSQHQTYLFRH